MKPGSILAASICSLVPTASILTAPSAARSSVASSQLQQGQGSVDTEFTPPARSFATLEVPPIHEMHKANREVQQTIACPPLLEEKRFTHDEKEFIIRGMVADVDCLLEEATGQVLGLLDDCRQESLKRAVAQIFLGLGLTVVAVIALRGIYYVQVTFSADRRARWYIVEQAMEDMAAELNSTRR